MLRPSKEAAGLKAASVLWLEKCPNIDILPSLLSLRCSHRWERARSPTWSSDGKRLAEMCSMVVHRVGVTAQQRCG